MREENLNRLTTLETRISDPIYLHNSTLFRDVAAAISEHGKGDVIDIGCGNKPYQHLFKNKGKYVGCDIVQSSDMKVDVLCSVTDIPIEDKQFDTVFSTQVLEHVAEHSKMLSEAFRLLKNGGTIILSAPMCWQHHEVPYDFYRFTKYGLQHLFEKAGFTSIEIKANGGKWALLGQMAQNTIMSSTRGKKGAVRAFFRFVHKYFLKYVINLLCSYLERVDKDEEFATLNFVVVAKKP
ncbi:MAG: methyltransferase domain-containing protein [Chitinophagaceae bacterium]|nr:methyltransferase domain-containing protein [Chitinophagaceae bacterium]